MIYDKYFDEAESSYVEGDYIGALSLFKKVYELEGLNDSLNYIGCCYLELNDLESAIKIFEELIEKLPDWERPIFNLGRVYLKCGELERALEYFEKSLSLNPMNEDAYYYMGIYYYEISDYENAQRYYEKSLQINDVQWETHLNLGMCFIQRDMFKEALVEFNKSYEYSSTSKDAVRNIGLVLLIQKKYLEALDKFLEFTKLETDNIDNMLDISHCYYKLYEFENAITWVKKILIIEPNNETANRLLKIIKSKSQEKN